MKNTFLLSALVSVFNLSGIAVAKQTALPERGGRGGGYGGKGGSGGIEGDVQDIGSSSFILSTKDKTMKVRVNGQTRFIEDNKDVPASHLKKGAHVTVGGGMSGPNEFLATFVTLKGEGHGKK